MSQRNKKSGILLLMALLSLFSVQAYAKNYTCPKNIQSSLPAGFELWRDPQATESVNQIRLYDGHPREMADLEPDNGDAPNAKGNFWTLYDNPLGFWMVCVYPHTDRRYIKRVDNPQKFCKIKSPSVLQCK